jgi:hypothetical protein
MIMSYFQPSAFISSLFIVLALAGVCKAYCLFAQVAAALKRHALGSFSLGLVSARALSLSQQGSAPVETAPRSYNDLFL